jgi:hypothetical protein
METLMLLRRFIVCSGISIACVCVLAGINVAIAHVLAERFRFAETMEIVIYSLFKIGPFVFIWTFLGFFFVQDALQEQWRLATTSVILAMVLLVATLIVDVIFIPRIRFQ